MCICTQMLSMPLCPKPCCARKWAGALGLSLCFCSSQHTGFSSCSFQSEEKEMKMLFLKEVLASEGQTYGELNTQRNPDCTANGQPFGSVGEEQWVRHSLPGPFWGSAGKQWTHSTWGVAGFFSGWDLGLHYPCKLANGPALSRHSGDLT